MDGWMDGEHTIVGVKEREEWVGQEGGTPLFYFKCRFNNNTDYSLIAAIESKMLYLMGTYETPLGTKRRTRFDDCSIVESILITLYKYKAPTSS